jgi:hypothetical protein
MPFFTRNLSLWRSSAHIAESAESSCGPQPSSLRYAKYSSRLTFKFQSRCRRIISSVRYMN